MTGQLVLPANYTTCLPQLKQRVQAAQQRAVRSVNSELVLLYWQIGRDILDRQQAQSWCAKVNDRLAKDLHSAFRDMKRFSRSNLMYMRAFHEAWPEKPIVQQLVGRLPRGQNVLLLTKLKTRAEREGYAAQAIEQDWSRNVMWHHISSQLQQRSGQAASGTVTWQMNYPNRSKPNSRTTNEPAPFA